MLRLRGGSRSFTSSAVFVKGNYPLRVIAQVALPPMDRIMAATPLSRVRQAAAKLRRAEEAVRVARGELRTAIVSAREDGESLAAIARTIGVTRQRVKQIIGG